MKITEISQLRELYGFAKGRAKDKVFSKLDKHAINFIEKSPFLVISTSNKKGKLDASPRGGKSGFVKVTGERILIIPDAKGNNRIDSLTNIIETNQVGLLFLIPGVDETLRVNGSAYITTDSKYLELFPLEQNTPKSFIIITVEEMFLHCAKAFMRSRLWHEESLINRKELPTIGEMLKDQLQSEDHVESQEEMIKRYQKDL